MRQELRCSQTAIYISIWLCLKRGLKLVGPIIIVVEPVVSKKLATLASNQQQLNFCHPPTLSKTFKLLKKK
jgi:hypothetical protein